MTKLQECELDPDMAWSYPMIHERPEEAWTASMETGRVPASLFKLYCIADYFSLGRAPKFLSDPDRVLFAYLKALGNGIRESFENAGDLLDELREAEKRHYTFLKKMRGEPWDDKAPLVSRRTFRYLLLEISGVLDQTAETVALILFGSVPGLPLGRAEFRRLVGMVRERVPVTSEILSPSEAQRERLFDVIASELSAEGPETDWLDLFYLYRNKTTHIGSYMFPCIGLRKLETELFPAFLPNRWPVFMEQHASVGSRGEKIDLRRFFESEFIHQDLEQYAEGLIARTLRLAEAVFAVLYESYRLLADCDPDPRRIEGLMKHKEAWRFQHFVTAASPSTTP